jgi:hypothetical protein
LPERYSSAGRQCDESERLSLAHGKCNTYGHFEIEAPLPVPPTFEVGVGSLWFSRSELGVEHWVAQPDLAVHAWAASAPTGLDA